MGYEEIQIVNTLTVIVKYMSNAMTENIHNTTIIHITVLKLMDIIKIKILKLYKIY